MQQTAEPGLPRHARGSIERTAIGIGPTRPVLLVPVTSPPRPTRQQEAHDHRERVESASAAHTTFCGCHSKWM